MSARVNQKRTSLGAASPIAAGAAGAASSVVTTQLTAATFFSTPPQAMLDDVCNCSEDHMVVKITELERAMKTAVPGNSKAIAEAADRILAFLRKRFHTYFGMFEQYASKNIFHVPELDFSSVDGASPSTAALGAASSSVASSSDDCACLPSSVHTIAASTEHMQLDAAIRAAQTKLHAERFVTQAMRTELAQLHVELAQYAEVAPALHAVAGIYYPAASTAQLAPLNVASLKAMSTATEELEAELSSIQKLMDSSNAGASASAATTSAATKTSQTSVAVPAVFALASAMQ